jgi:dynactin complex subunit
VRTFFAADCGNEIFAACKGVQEGAMQIDGSSVGYVLQTGSAHQVWKRQYGSADSITGFYGQGDRVTISDEAWRLLEEQKAAALENSKHVRGIKEEEGETVESIKARAAAQEGEEAASSGSVSGNGGIEQIEKLKKQIEELQARIAEITSSPVSDEQKMQQIAPLQAQVQSLEQQLMALQASLK